MKSRVRRVRSAANVEPVREEVAEYVEEVPHAEDELDQNEGADGVEDMDRIENKYRARADSPLRAIRAFCVLCMGCQPRLVANCTATNCVLYPYRLGKNPHQRHSKTAKTRGPKV